MSRYHSHDNKMSGLTDCLCAVSLCLDRDRERADEFAGTGPDFGFGSGPRPSSAPAAPHCVGLLLLPQEDRRRRVSTSAPAVPR